MGISASLLFFLHEDSCTRKISSKCIQYKIFTEIWRHKSRFFCYGFPNFSKCIRLFIRTLKWYILLNRNCMGLTTWAKFGTNLRTKLILPKNECISFWVLGRPILEIYLVHFGSMIIPSFNTTKPNSLPCVTTKMDFLGLREMLNFLHLSNTCFKADKWSCHFLE